MLINNSSFCAFPQKRTSFLVDFNHEVCTFDIEATVLTRALLSNENSLVINKL